MPKRRLLLVTGAAVAAAIALPALAASRRAMAPMTEGPFYPPAAWRGRWPDWDADLTRVERDGRVLRAQGEALGLQLVAMDTDERVLDGAEVEIWQCDVRGQYRHPRVAQAAGTFDEGFQGFGAARAGRDGAVSFRTIRPAPYPGRTPHIHVRLRHPSLGEVTSQLFVAGEAGNARDFLWNALPAADRDALALRLQPAPADSGLAHVARHALVVPA